MESRQWWMEAASKYRYDHSDRESLISYMVFTDARCVVWVHAEENNPAVFEVNIW